ncbi:MAG: D-alanyl-D-alanine carboxypeptidase [Clostridiales bacterium]|nr:D-alanyl-D-alanine carboxypeptidase [Clostridiales bacterium]
MKLFFSVLLSTHLLLSSFPIPVGTSIPVLATEMPTENSINVSAESVLLMEASTGTILFEKNSHEALRPASVTKIMTLLLIFDALSAEQISLADTVTVSEHAASMGGSQVYLEPGETQTVDTMIKCISIASANDACVAMAEHIAGSEEEFVRRMNERAKGLGMNDTHFVNCCGLEAEGHLTSAFDVALMSRELTAKYPQIHNYCTVWMENITHTTAKGSSEFGLTNTNKLIKHYEYATGLKTGFTSLAKYCISATAERDGMKLIAVIMAAPDANSRTADALALFHYGFGQCRIYTDANQDALPSIPLQKSIIESTGLCYEGPFRYVSTNGTDLSGITKAIELPQAAQAPIHKGEVAGKAVYSLNGKEIGSVNILFTEDIDAASYKDYFYKVFLFLIP